MCPGISTSHFRVDGCTWTSVPNFSSRRSPDSLTLVLAPGDSHAVARDDDDLLCTVDHHGDLIGDLNRPRLLGHRRPFAASSKGLEQHIRQRSVHGLAHDEGEDEARGTHQGPCHDEHGAADDESCEGGGDTREGVEQRDDHGHVGAADGQARVTIPSRHEMPMMAHR